MEAEGSGVKNADEMSLLARKLRASRPGQGPMDVLEEHSIRLAMARAGRKALDCDVLVTSVARASVGVPADLGLSLSSISLVSGLLSKCHLASAFESNTMSRMLTVHIATKVSCENITESQISICTASTHSALNTINETVI